MNYESKKKAKILHAHGVFPSDIFLNMIFFYLLQQKCSSSGYRTQDLLLSGAEAGVRVQKLSFLKIPVFKNRIKYFLFNERFSVGDRLAASSGCFLYESAMYTNSASHTKQQLPAPSLEFRLCRASICRMME